MNYLTFEIGLYDVIWFMKPFLSSGIRFGYYIVVQPPQFNILLSSDVTVVKLYPLLVQV
jgi:hypothetical protein